MFSLRVQDPTRRLSVYPERRRIAQHWLLHAGRRVGSLVLGVLFPTGREQRRLVLRVAQYDSHYSALESQGFRSEAQLLRQQFTHLGQMDALATQCFALAAAAARRELGIKIHDEQLIGGWVMYKGGVAQMATGEGKSVACMLAACAAALSGTPVHVISTDDRQAERNATWFGPVYAALGLKLGLVVTDSSIGHRRKAYHSDVTYCSSRQVAFDYLQDRLLLQRHRGSLHMQIDALGKDAKFSEQLRLQGLCCAFVDDADSVLVEDGLAPLILCRSGRTVRTPEEADAEVVARISFPRFFQRYLKLGGVGAELQGLSTELYRTYGLKVRRIAPRRDVTLEPAPRQVFASESEKWAAICAQVAERHAKRQPVIVAVSSDEAAERLSIELSAASIPHQLPETLLRMSIADVEERAGLPGAVTVTTMLAAPGNRVSSGSTSREFGGLHVILSELHRFARIDNRVLDRTRLSGEPCSTVAMLSLEDAQATQFLPPWLISLSLRFNQLGANRLLKHAQKMQERADARARRRLLVAEQQLDEVLAFSGMPI